MELNAGGNAVGTGINTHPQIAQKVLAHLQKQTKTPWKLSLDPIEATQSETDLAEYSSSLELLSLDLTKIANDLRLLASGPNTGLNEIRLPAVEPGSSIMPGKINPSMIEMLNMVCIQVQGNHHAIELASQAGQLELNVMTPVLAKNLLENQELLTNGIRQFNHRCLQGIKANPERLKNYFEKSEGLATFLNPKIGYEAAAQIAKKAAQKNQTIRQTLSEKKLFSEKDLKRLFDYQNVTRPNLKRIIKRKNQKN